MGLRERLRYARRAAYEPNPILSEKMANLPRPETIGALAFRSLVDSLRALTLERVPYLEVELMKSVANIGNENVRRQPVEAQAAGAVAMFEVALCSAANPSDDAIDSVMQDGGGADVARYREALVAGSHEYGASDEATRILRERLQICAAGEILRHQGLPHRQGELAVWAWFLFTLVSGPGPASRENAWAFGAISHLGDAIASELTQWFAVFNP